MHFALHVKYTGCWLFKQACIWLYLYHTDPCLSKFHQIPHFSHQDVTRNGVAVRYLTGSRCATSFLWTYTLTCQKQSGAVHFLSFFPGRCHCPGGCRGRRAVGDCGAVAEGLEGPHLPWHVEPQNRWCSRLRQGPMWIMLLGAILSYYIFIWFSILTTICFFSMEYCKVHGHSGIWSGHMKRIHSCNVRIPPPSKETHHTKSQRTLKPWAFFWESIVASPSTACTL